MSHQYAQAAKLLKEQNSGSLCATFEACANPDSVKDSPGLESIDPEAHLEERRTEQKIHDHQYTEGGLMKGEASLTVAGRMVTGAGFSAFAQLQGSGRTAEEQKRTRFHQFLMMMENLQRQLDDIDARLKEIDKSMEALDKARKLYAAGQLNPAENPLHAQLLAEAGITETELEQNGAQAFDDQQSELEQERGRLREQRAQVEADQLALQQQDNEYLGTVRMDADVLAQNFERNAELIQQRKEIEAQLAALGEENPGTEAVSGRQATRSPDKEIGDFIRGYAETMKISDPLERLRAQKALLEGLSEVAAFDLSLEREYAALFTQQDYFAALEQEQGSAQVDAAHTADLQKTDVQQNVSSLKFG